MTKRGPGLTGLLLLLALVLPGCGLDVDADHTVAEAAPKPMADRGPAPGTYERVWRITARTTGRERASYRLVAGNLVVATKAGLSAYDARTGKPAWRYREPGRRLWSIAEAGGAIVLGTYREEGDSIKDRHMVGLDAGTGEHLWEETEDWVLLTDGSSGSSTPPQWGDAADGVVVVEPDSPFERVGVEARTGKTLWTVDTGDVAEECTDRTGRGSGAIVLTRMSCGLPDNVVVALDARSGELRWRRSLPPMGSPAVRTTMSEGVTLWDETGAAPVLIGPAGEELYTGPKDGTCSCELVVTGGRALLSYRVEKARQNVLASIDLRTGKAVRVKGWAARGMARAVAGGRLYELRPSVTEGFVATLAPAGLSVTDAARGSVRGVPLPFANPYLTQHVGAVQPASWLGVAGERLFLAAQSQDGPPVISSYRLRGTKEPLELGGVPVSGWPDPCALLSGLPGRRDKGEPVTIGSVTLPALGCVVYPDDGGKASRLDVLWVSPTEQEAAELMRGVPPEWRPTGINLVRVGRVIVGVNAEEDTTIALVERNLRALG